MPRALRAFFTVSVLLLAGCDRSFTQTVTIRFLDGNALPLRYYSGPGCTGEFVAIPTVSVAENTFTRTAIRGGVGVLLEEPSLCYERNGTWLAAWQELVDPPNHDTFSCSTAPGGELRCTQLPQGGT